MSHTFKEKCMSEDAKRDVANLYRYVQPGFDVRTFVFALRNIAENWEGKGAYVPLNIETWDGLPPSFRDNPLPTGLPEDEGDHSFWLGDEE